MLEHILPSDNSLLMSPDAVRQIQSGSMRLSACISRDKPVSIDHNFDRLPFNGHIVTWVRLEFDSTRALRRNVR